MKKIIGLKKRTLLFDQQFADDKDDHYKNLISLGHILPVMSLTIILN